MSIENKILFIPIFIFIIVWFMIILKKNSAFSKWVHEHWFVKPKKKNRLGNIFMAIGLSFLLLSLLDFRGEEQKIEGKTSDQKTIILIDSSASMMAEDIRPNRFEKALFLAKHYAKRAVGQKVSVMVFSDSYERIVPFTDDIALVSARIDGLKKLNLRRGGTSLQLAIQEAIQFLGSDEKTTKGNILIFTDSEETDGGIELNVPDSVSVGVIAIGTARGSTVPIRNSKGEFIGNKKYRGKDVISKLDEAFLKKLGDSINNYRYWIASSYSLPTQEILGFFKRIQDLKESDKDFRVKPVLFHIMIIPAFIFYFVGLLLRQGRTFKMSSYLWIVFMLFTLPLKNLEAQEEIKKDEPVKSEKTLALEEKLMQGNLDQEGKNALAQSLLKDGFIDASRNLYNESLGKKITDKNFSDHFNHATSYLKSKQLPMAAKKYQEMLDLQKQNKLKISDEDLKKVKENLAKALMSGQGGSGKNSDDESDSDQNKDSKGNDKSSGKKSDKKDKNGKDGEKDKKEEDKKDKSSSGDKEQDQQKNKQPENNPDKNDPRNPENKDKVSKKKMPRLLKQLLSDDQNLQEKLIDAKTVKRKDRDQKDW